MLCEEVWKRRRKLEREERAASIVKEKTIKIPQMFSSVVLLVESHFLVCYAEYGLDWMGSDEMDYQWIGWDGMAREERRQATIAGYVRCWDQTCSTTAAYCSRLAT